MRSLFASCLILASATAQLPAGVTPQYVVTMVGAFLQELAYQNRLNSLNQCVVGGP